MIREKLLKKEIYKGKLRKIISITISIVFIILLTACSEKYSIENFQEKIEKEGFTTMDISDNDKKMMIAVGDHYQIYYYEYDSKKKTKKKILEEIKDYKDIEKQENEKCNMYYEDSNNIYTIYVNKENTYVMVSTVNTYKKKVQEVLKSIGYYCK